MRISANIMLHLSSEGFRVWGAHNTLSLLKLPSAGGIAPKR